MKNAKRSSVAAVTSAVSWFSTTITRATPARMAMFRANGFMQSCMPGRRARPRRASRRRTRAGAHEDPKGRRATATGRTAARTSRTRSADDPSRAGGRREAGARAPPGRRSASAQARAAARRTCLHGCVAPRTLPPRQARRRRSGGMRSRGAPLASRESYRGAVMVEEGKPAPEFALQSDAGETVRLADLRGKQVVLYFYPKDDTPGCTTQACGIRDVYAEFERAGAVVLGVSPDTEASHVKFKEKYGLPFTLLADPDHAVSDQYGVWAEKKYMGRTYMGVNRSTFVIDADGTVKRAMHNVKPATH